MSINIHDIAKKAGVSTATVSLALNGRPGVSQKTKLKVLEIAQQMDYVPNMMAQGLQGGRTNNIAVLMSGPQYDYFNSPFYFETLKHFAKGLSNTPFQMVLHITTAEQELKNLKMVVSRKGFDGIVIMGLRMRLEEALLIIGDIPCVFVNHPNDKGACSVNANYGKAMYLLTKHLLELGHREIAFFVYIPNLAPAETRLTGYKKAFEEYELEIKPELLLYADYYQESGYLAMRKWIQSGNQLPSAIIGGNDLIAIGILEALYDVGISVPEEVSLVGVDNVSNTHLLKVPLTTVQIRNDLIGMEAFKKIIGLLQEEEVEKETWIDVQLIKRASTAAPKAAVI